MTCILIIAKVANPIELSYMLISVSCVFYGKVYLHNTDMLYRAGFFCDGFGFTVNYTNCKFKWQEIRKIMLNGLAVIS